MMTIFFIPVIAVAFIGTSCAYPPPLPSSVHAVNPEPHLKCSCEPHPMSAYTCSCEPVNARGPTSPDASVCQPLNYDRIPSPSIYHEYRMPFAIEVADIITVGNDVYVIEVVGFIETFNSQVGNGIKMRNLATTDLNVYGGSQWDVKDGYMYGNTIKKGIVSAKLNDVSGMVRFESLFPIPSTYGVKWSPDGERVLIYHHSRRANIDVYDKNQHFIKQLSYCDEAVPGFDFDSHGNIRVAGKTKFCIYDKDNYNLVSSIAIQDVQLITDYAQHCDGTIIVADYYGKMLFLNQDYQTLHIVEGFDQYLSDKSILTHPENVAVTRDGTIYFSVGDPNVGPDLGLFPSAVADYRNEIFVYSNN